MTPEEAKPHTDFDIEITYRSGKKQTKTVLSPTPFFTAKETVEIAKAYARALNGATASELPYLSVMESIAKAKKMRGAWENKFEEWSK